MDDLGTLVNNYLAAADEAQQELQRRHGVPIDTLAIQEILVERLTLKRSVDLPYQGLTKDKILSLLADIDFAGMHKCVIAEVVLQEGILSEGLIRLLTDATAKVSNEIWRLHKGDPDPFPCDPHAHNVQTGLKLDLRNGYLYKKRQPRGAIKWNHLLAIRQKFEEKQIALPALAA